MGIDTKELLNKLKRTSHIQSFLDAYQDEFLTILPIEYMTELLKMKNMSLSQIANYSGQGEYVYKVFRGERKPSRDVVLAIAIGMQLSLEETQLLLRVSKLALLDPRDKRDSVIIYAIKESHNIHQTNDLLFDLKEQTL